ncbi:MAG: DUF3857 domain-containing protein [Cyclobacteriaceae bacterium]
MLFRILSGIALLLLIVPCCVAQTVKKNSSPAWVISNKSSLEIDSQNNPTGSFYYLLIERQLNLSSEERFNRNIFKILSSEGVQEMSDISVDFDPEYESLTFNSIVVYRNGEKIDKLKQAKINIAQREQSMDRYLYDGTKTAYVNLTDIRSGDIIEYSYTLKGYNPVFRGHFSQFFYFDYSFGYQKLFQRVIIRKGDQMFMHYRNGDVTPAITETTANKEYTWIIENNKPFLTDNNAPGWYDPFRYMAITDFKDWSDVKKWSAEQFRVTPEQVAKVKSKLPAILFTGSANEKLLNSIRFVQDEVRYLGFENGVNSHKPHKPEQVLDQRFGDCKDKSLLLSVIARIHGFEAFPVLVNTSIQNKVDEEPPTYFAFDHCVVEINNMDTAFFVDPTINNQGGDLRSLYFPNYQKGLILDSEERGFSELPTTTLSGTTEEQTFELSEIGGSATMRVKTTYTGKDADVQRSEFASTTIENTSKNYQNFYASMYPGIAVEKTPEVKDDRSKNIITVDEFYLIKDFWKPEENSVDKIFCEFYPQSISRLISVEKSADRKAPYRLTYPLLFKHETVVKLPESWNAENDSRKIESDYYRFYNSVTNSDNEIRIVNEYETKVNEVPAEFVDTFVNDHEKMLSELNYMLNYNKALTGQSSDGKSTPFPIITLLIATAAGIWLVLRLNKFNPPSHVEYGTSIGGWLILPAIGLCISPFRDVYTLVQAENNFFNGGIWTALYTSGQHGLLLLLTLELTYNILSLFFTGLLIMLFFQRRTSLPRLIIFFYAISLGITVFDEVAVLLISGEPVTSSEIIKPAVAATIWIPYFAFSQRVKETFTVRL